MRKVKSVPTDLRCPDCGAELVVRWGKNGEFLGCSAYPKCGFTGDFSRDARGRIALQVEGGALGPAPAGEGEAPVTRPQTTATGLTCPKCGKELVVRRGRMGEFLGCSGYPKCKFTQNFTRDAQGRPVPLDKEAETAAFPCPREGCSGGLVKRRSRRGIFYGCNNYPKCDFTLNQPPLEGPCPQCAFPWLMKKGKKVLCPKDECDYQQAAVAEG
jgi:DNA topoisomerase-1